MTKEVAWTKNSKGDINILNSLASAMSSNTYFRAAHIVTMKNGVNDGDGG